MKRIVLVLCTVLLALSGMAIISCGGSGDAFETVTVATPEELKNASGKRVVLANDIDFEHESVTEISCVSLDGQGHTVKNVVVNGSGLFGDMQDGRRHRFMEYIKNVTFDGISVHADGGQAGVLVGSIADNHYRTEGFWTSEDKHFNLLFERVCVVNSSVSSEKETRVGGMVGQLGSVNKFDSATFDNCVVDNVDLNVENGGTVGGIIANVSGNATVKNCTVKNSRLRGSAIYIGGIIGSANSRMSNGGGFADYDEVVYSITNSNAIDNDIEADRADYKIGSFNILTTSSAYVGGLVGYSATSTKSEIAYSYASGNQILVHSSGTACAGNILGKASKVGVEQCYAVDNKIIADSYYTSKQNASDRHVGGFGGSITDATFASCFAANNGIADVAEPASNLNSFCGGFVGYIKSIIAQKCGVYNNEILAVVADEFCYAEITWRDCCVSSEKYGNRNGCDVKDEGFWTAGEDAKEYLRLLGSLWEFEDGKLPCLTVGANIIE